MYICVKLFVVIINKLYFSTVSPNTHVAFPLWTYRFFFGKNKVMAIALGKSEEEEVLPNIHKLSSLLQGQCGLLFTNKKKEEVVE